MKPGTLVSMVVAGKLHLTKKLKIYAKVCQVDPKEALKDDYYIVDDDFDENEGEDSEKEYSEVDSLKDCDGDCNGMVEVGDFIKELVKFTPNLEHFSVTVLHDNLGSDALQALADYCPKLEVLLCKGDLEGAPYAEVPQPLRFPALRYLQLFNPSLTLLERFVAGAPKLEQTVVYRPVYVGVLFEDDSAMARWADRHDFTIFWGHLKHGKCGMPRHIRCRNFRITSPENSKAPVTYSSLFKWYGESLEGAAHRRARVSI
ncbi:hypothetical protein F4677DRAFT_458798 [Hypoxylon crocopeplum]|nr:hypothetical protein F4677DRAFT_458798 [Hypoxylon crocopeplum]